MMIIYLCIGGGEIDRNGLFPGPDFVINELQDKGMNTNDTISLCKKGVTFDREKIELQFSNMIEKIRLREASWDIKMSEFILDNYKKVKLFYDPWHPTNYTLRYIAEKVLSMLGIDSTGMNSDIVLDTHEEPVYPKVAEILGLEWRDNEIRKSNNAKKILDYMDFDEYCREYMWCRNVRRRSL